MCGIAGFWDFKKTLSEKESEKISEKMNLAIKERGPDSSGIWHHEGLTFSHRRLAIQDLSPQGHQPMHSPSKRFTMVYNGEVYNGSVLGQELSQKGYTFKGHSDTEVMLAAFEEWGLEQALSKFIGMFAFALWDQKQEKLYLVRDRLGIKPLYWGFSKGTLFFGSQPKSFKEHPHWEGKIDQKALTSFFQFGYVPAPQSIYEGIQKLEPGKIVEVGRDAQPVLSHYWRMEDSYKAEAFQGSFEEAKEELHGLLKDAVKQRMLADVPLGAFLSGGVDSSAVVALMQSQSSKPIKTFSIGFHEALYNEAQHAKKVAEHLGTDHHELYVTPKEAQSVIPDLPQWYDEPFADSSQIPTYLVSKLARGHVTVSLSGDGGDEFFAGYTRYFVGEKLWRKVSALPYGLRCGLASVVRAFPSGFWDGLEPILPRGFPTHLADKATRFSELLTKRSLREYYKTLVSQWQNGADLVVGARAEDPALWSALEKDQKSHIPTMQFLDSMTYLPDDILAKVDRASMAVSLEARVPLLDHRVVEYAWKLPLSMKVSGGQGKHILRSILYDYVPKNLIERPKMGFGVPIGEWMRGDLRDWAESLLSEEALKSSGLLNAAPITKRWEEHLKGKHNWQYSLWCVLMFQAWFKDL